MSKENILTINLIVPYTGLIQLLEIATPITEVGKEFCKALLGKAQKRLLYYEETSIARIAAILDPRMREVAFYKRKNYDNAVQALNDIVRNKLKKIHEQVAASALIAQTQNCLTATDRPATTSCPDLLRRIMSAKQTAGCQKNSYYCRSNYETERIPNKRRQFAL